MSNGQDDRIRRVVRQARVTDRIQSGKKRPLMRPKTINQPSGLKHAGRPYPCGNGADPSVPFRVPKWAGPSRHLEGSTQLHVVQPAGRVIEMNSSSLSVPSHTARTANRGRVGLGGTDRGRGHPRIHPRLNKASAPKWAVIDHGDGLTLFSRCRRDLVADPRANY